MSDTPREQIYNNLNLKETDELVEIWKKNDRVEWAEATFGVLEEIIQERLDKLPPQDEPVLEYSENDTKKEQDDELTDVGNSPAFYKPKDVSWLVTWLCRAAIAAVIATSVSCLLELPELQSNVWTIFNSNLEWKLASWLIAIMVFVFAVILQCIILYFPLKALGSILKILMEMEFNSRGEKTKIT
jgi:hypothetical protein